jgi:hypothetical protein
MNKNTKFCIDCECYDFAYGEEICSSLQTPYKRDLVHGKYHSQSLSCEDARNDKKLCGYEAKWFKPKKGQE